MAEPLIGRTFGRFHVVERLGAGGMGEVYRAHDRHLKRDVAIKLLRWDTPEAARRQMRREAHALSTLNHPNIATIHDLVEADGVSFVVMEHIAGASLAQKLEAGPLGAAEVVALARQIAAGLAEAHRHGIVHRDLKPGNIMLTAAGQLKLVDFGISARMASAEAATATVSNPGSNSGTLPYMAPEQLLGGNADVRSDIWAFGVVLYEMASGRRPFAGADAVALAKSILNAEPDRPGGAGAVLPAGLAVVILKALQKEPEERFGSVGEMLAALESPEAQPTAVTVPYARRRSGPRGSRRARVALAATAGLALAIFAVAGGRWLAKPDAPASRLSVLVGDTVNRTGDATFDDTLTELLTASLNQSRYLAVFPRPRANYVLRLMQREPTTPIDETVGLEICQREGVGALVSASISPLGAAYLLLVRVTDPTGRELASARESFANPAEAPTRIDAVVRSLRAGVGESAASIRASSLPLAEVSSDSLEAVKFYTLGLQRQRAGDPAQALVMFQKALAVDAEFAMAEDAIGLVYTNIQDLARAEEHLARAAALADRVAEAERHKILADYNLLRRDYDVACGHLQVLTELRPLDPISFIALGNCKGFQLDFAGAIAVTERGLEMQSYPLGRAILARYQLGGGQAETALATADALRQEQPTNMQAHFVAGRAELALGRFSAARRTYETMVAHGGDMETEGRLGLADLALATGRLAAARQELEAAWQAASRRGIALAVGRAAATSAELALSTAEPEAFARAMARLADARHPVVLYLKARCQARAGQSAEARASLAELAAATSDSEPDQALLALVRAEVELAEGHADRAIEAASAAWGFEPSVLARETQARASVAAGDRARAILLYEEVLARQTEWLDAYDAPGFHRILAAKYRLAVLLDDTGAVARARPYLEALVQAWEGADPPSPALADVQRRLAKQPPASP